MRARRPSSQPRFDRLVSCSVLGLLAALASRNSWGQSNTSCLDTVVFGRSYSLSAPELRSPGLDDELKKVRLRYQKGVAIAEGRANVAIAKLQAAERIADARFARVQARNERSQRRRVATLARYERQRQEAQVEVAIFEHLHWPEGLRHDSLRLQRNLLEQALGGEGRFVSAGAALDLDEVRRLTAEMYAAIRPLRNRLGDRQLLAAKHYLEGVVRAAEAEAEEFPRLALAAR